MIKTRTYTLMKNILGLTANVLIYPIINLKLILKNKNIVIKLLNNFNYLINNFNQKEN